MATLQSLPRETLDEIFSHLTPNFADDASASWAVGSQLLHRERASLQALLASCRSCKTLLAPATAKLYGAIMLGHHRRMVMLLRTLVGNPSLRGAIRSLSICFTLYFGDGLTEDYSVREYYLNEAPGYDMRTNWDTQLMDPVARDVFRHVGLDCSEFKEFDEYELEQLNNNEYWSSIPDYAKRADREERLAQCIALALMCLATEMSRLCLWLGEPTRSSYGKLNLGSLNFYINEIMRHEPWEVRIAPSLVTLVLKGGSTDNTPGVPEIPTLRDIVIKTNGGQVERDSSEMEEQWL